MSAPSTEATLPQAIAIEKFEPVVRNTLRGFARVRMPSGMVLHDVGIHQQGGAAWASPASKPQLDRNGQHMKDAAGKAKWAPVVSFASRELRAKFSASIINAVRASYPEALS
jgi:hypothetical protein